MDLTPRPTRGESLMDLTPRPPLPQERGSLRRGLLAQGVAQPRVQLFEQQVTPQDK